jgi:hypothetical protein
VGIAEGLGTSMRLLYGSLVRRHNCAKNDCLSRLSVFEVCAPGRSFIPIRAPGRSGNRVSREQAPSRAAPKSLLLANSRQLKRRRSVRHRAPRVLADHDHDAAGLDTSYGFGLRFGVHVGQCQGGPHRGGMVF